MKKSYGIPVLILIISLTGCSFKTETESQKIETEPQIEEKKDNYSWFEKNAEWIINLPDLDLGIVFERKYKKPGGKAFEKEELAPGILEYFIVKESEKKKNTYTIQVASKNKIDQLEQVCKGEAPPIVCHKRKEKFLTPAQYDKQKNAFYAGNWHDTNPKPETEGYDLRMINGQKYISVDEVSEDFKSITRRYILFKDDARVIFEITIYGKRENWNQGFEQHPTWDVVSPEDDQAIDRGFESTSIISDAQIEIDEFIISRPPGCRKIGKRANGQAVFARYEFKQENPSGLGCGEGLALSSPQSYEKKRKECERYKTGKYYSPHLKCSRDISAADIRKSAEHFHNILWQKNADHYKKINGHPFVVEDGYDVRGASTFQHYTTFINDIRLDFSYGFDAYLRPNPKSTRRVLYPEERKFADYGMSIIHIYKPTDRVIKEGNIHITLPAGYQARSEIYESPLAIYNIEKPEYSGSKIVIHRAEISSLKSTQEAIDACAKHPEDKFPEYLYDCWITQNKANADQYQEQQQAFMDKKGYVFPTEFLSKNSKKGGFDSGEIVFKYKEIKGEGYLITDRPCQFMPCFIRSYVAFRGDKKIKIDLLVQNRQKESLSLAEQKQADELFSTIKISNNEIKLTSLKSNKYRAFDEPQNTPIIPAK